jgi:hypothetical protein
MQDLRKDSVINHCTCPNLAIRTRCCEIFREVNIYHRKTEPLTDRVGQGHIGYNGSTRMPQRRYHHVHRRRGSSTAHAPAVAPRVMMWPRQPPPMTGLPR